MPHLRPSQLNPFFSSRSCPPAAPIKVGSAYDRRVLLAATRLLRLAVTLGLGATASCTTASPSNPQATDQEDHRKIVRASFDRWRAGTGGPFELLDEQATWTIVGSSVVARSYHGKEPFMAGVIRPFNARMDQPLKPTIRNLYVDADTVIVVFDAESRCVDGSPYRNTYAWFMQMSGGRAIRVTAFFDSKQFDEMWARVAPR